MRRSGTERMHEAHGSGRPAQGACWQRCRRMESRKWLIMSQICVRIGRVAAVQLRRFRTLHLCAAHVVLRRTAVRICSRRILMPQSPPPDAAAASTWSSLRATAVAAVEALLADATAKVRERVVVEGQPVGRLLDREQRATHGLAWLATYVEAVRQLAAYAERMAGDGTLGEIEELLVRIGLGEYLAQILGGIPMSQGEIVRPCRSRPVAPRRSRRASRRRSRALIATGNTARTARRLVELMRAGHGATVGDCGLDETLESIRDEMRKFADSEVIAHAQGWHRTNSYIPLEIIAQMAELGVFGLTIPGRVRRHGARQGIDVRRLGGAVARLYRRRLARHALGNRRRTDSRRRHRRAEAEMAAEDRVRRGAADGGVHRAEHRLRSRLAQDPRGARRRCLQGLRQQDLDHASGARRPDDAAGAHQSERARLSRPVDAARRKAARHRRRIRSRPRA